MVCTTRYTHDTTLHDERTMRSNSEGTFQQQAFVRSASPNFSTRNYKYGDADLTKYLARGNMQRSEILGQKDSAGTQFISSKMPRLIEGIAPPPVIYHYSDACDAIIKSDQLQHGSRGAWGVGVYFTGFEATIFPWTKIMDNTCAQSDETQKCVFVFRTDKLRANGYAVWRYDSQTKEIDPHYRVWKSSRASSSDIMVPPVDDKNPIPLSNFQMGVDYITVGHIEDEADHKRLRAFSAWARDQASKDHGWPRISRWSKEVDGPLVDPVVEGAARRRGGPLKAGSPAERVSVVGGGGPKKITLTYGPPMFPDEDFGSPPKTAPSTGFQSTRSTNEDGKLHKDKPRFVYHNKNPQSTGVASQLYTNGMRYTGRLWAGCGLLEADAPTQSEGDIFSLDDNGATLSYAGPAASNPNAQPPGPPPIKQTLPAGARPTVAGGNVNMMHDPAVNEDVSSPCAAIVGISVAVVVLVVIVVVIICLCRPKSTTIVEGEGTAGPPIGPNPDHNFFAGPIGRPGGAGGQCSAGGPNPGYGAAGPQFVGGFPQAQQMTYPQRYH